MPKPASIYKVTKDLPYRVGDRVKFTFGTAHAEGAIVEYRGPLGVGGRRLWGIEFRLDDVSDAMYIELAEEEFSPAAVRAAGRNGRPNEPLREPWTARDE